MGFGMFFIINYLATYDFSSFLPQDHLTLPIVLSVYGDPCSPNGQDPDNVLANCTWWILFPLSCSPSSLVTTPLHRVPRAIGIPTYAPMTCLDDINDGLAHVRCFRTAWPNQLSTTEMEEVYRILGSVVVSLSGFISMSFWVSSGLLSSTDKSPQGMAGRLGNFTKTSIHRVGCTLSPLRVHRFELEVGFWKKCPQPMGFGMFSFSQNCLPSGANHIPLLLIPGTSDPPHRALCPCGSLVSNWAAPKPSHCPL